MLVQYNKEDCSVHAAASSCIFKSLQRGSSQLQTVSLHAAWGAKKYSHQNCWHHLFP